MHYAQVTGEFSGSSKCIPLIALEDFWCKIAPAGLWFKTCPQTVPWPLFSFTCHGNTICLSPALLSPVLSPYISPFFILATNPYLSLALCRSEPQPESSAKQTDKHQKTPPNYLMPNILSTQQASGYNKELVTLAPNSLVKALFHCDSPIFRLSFKDAYVLYTNVSGKNR